MNRRQATLLALAAFAAACVKDTALAPRANTPSFAALAATGEASYVILGTGNALSDKLAADVAAAGGRLTAVIPQIGVAIASSSDPAFLDNAGKIPGVQGVAADLVAQWTEPDPQTNAVELTAEEEAAGSGPSANAVFGSTESFRLIQWAPDAIHAPEAWDAGGLGAGARVAIIDGGIRSTHVDIAPVLDAAHSTSFVAGQAFNTDVGTFWHGTHVAGIVAAPGNGIGTVGIAPAATIIGVKALHNGSGSFSAIIQAIVYAATPVAEGGAGADIINMSIGAFFDRQGAGLTHLVNAVSRATTYAYLRGVLVVASAGNESTDYDHTNNQVHLPSGADHTISISALGPLGWALGSTDLDRPASYTNFGQSMIDLAGPGGDFALPGNALCGKPRQPSGTVVTNCWVFDMVMAPCRGSGASNTSYCWAAGTSMSSPAVAGVAALIVGKVGHVGPQEILRRLLASADDLGKPGNDDFYGGGRVNALRAIQ